jgi:hypothetical protein
MRLHSPRRQKQKRPECLRSGSRASQLLLARLVQRSRRQQLGATGGHNPASRARRSWRDFFRLRKRPCERTSACGRRSRQAREAHRPGGSELARLVRQVHGGGASRDGAADVSDYDVIVIRGARKLLVNRVGLKKAAEHLNSCGRISCV